MVGDTVGVVGVQLQHQLFELLVVQPEGKLLYHAPQLRTRDAPFMGL